MRASLKVRLDKLELQIARLDGQPEEEPLGFTMDEFADCFNWCGLNPIAGQTEASYRRPEIVDQIRAFHYKFNREF